MHKKARRVFLLLSLISLTFIGFDYVYGHVGENPIPPNHCPLCQAYQSTESAQVFLAFLLLFGMLPIIGFIQHDSYFLPFSTNPLANSLRAPPAVIA